MNTLTRPSLLQPLRAKRERRFSPVMLIGTIMTLIIIVSAAVFWLVAPRAQSRAAGTLNGDCDLIVPAHPLTAQGLATPYQLVATNPANGPCNEGNAAQAAFVQAAVIDLAGHISIYNPLVIDQGTQPAKNPVVPVLPQGSSVGIWFGFNGNNLTLRSTQGSLMEGRCVNGLGGSIFGQFSYCNAPAFFLVANRAIRAKRLVPPALGTAKDGQPCPSVRDFSVVDQDQSDNVTTTYLVTNKGQVAQNTPANAAALQGMQTQTNGSDNRLLAIVLDSALECTPWMAPDLASQGQQQLTALPLNELQAATQQKAPMALVPSGDPMVLVNNQASLAKTDLYRLGVDQPLAPFISADTTKYCANLRNIAPPRLRLDQQFTQNAPSPIAGVNLFDFLVQRFMTSYGPGGLNCAQLLGLPDPFAQNQCPPMNTQQGQSNTGGCCPNGKPGAGHNKKSDLNCIQPQTTKKKK